MINLELMLYGVLLPSLWVLISVGEVEKTCGLHILHQKYYLARTVSMVLKIDICLVGGVWGGWGRGASPGRNSEAPT